MQPTKWDDRFLSLAEHIAQWSKDPSTKVGAVIVRPDKTVASMGYNGFPRRVVDDPAALADRPTKYGMVVHAEMNAVVTAREPLHGFTCVVWPFPPCSSCAAVLVQAGIRAVVAPEPTPEQIERWGDSFILMERMFRESGVHLLKVTK